MRPNRLAYDTAKASGTHVRRLYQPASACFHAALLACLSVVAPFLHAADVYRGVDAQGVVTFSDIPTPGAVVVQVEPASPRILQSREEALAEQQRIIDQQLAVADSLEASRLAREDARARRREALAAAQPPAPPAEPEVRYVGGYGYQHRGDYPGWNPGYPSYPSHPWHPGVPGRPGNPDRPGHPGGSGHTGGPGHPAQPIAPPPPESPSSFPVRFPYKDR